MTENLGRPALSARKEQNLVWSEKFEAMRLLILRYLVRDDMTDPASARQRYMLMRFDHNVFQTERAEGIHSKAFDPRLEQHDGRTAWIEDRNDHNLLLN